VTSWRDPSRAASFRPAIEIDRTSTRVLVERTGVVDAQRLGSSAGRLDGDELRAIDEALALVFGLR
jgi:mRNA-degrading endonuclease toxin of MazEF toxin-antitoxin module